MSKNDGKILSRSTIGGARHDGTRKFQKDVQRRRRAAKVSRKASRINRRS